MVRPVTNHDLDGLLTEAGYANSHAAFARQINHALRDRGEARYDAASVYWWLRGRCPEPPIRTTIASVLNRKLRRPVTSDDLGFDDDIRLGLTYPGSPDQAIDTAAKLWRLVARRRDVLATAPFVTTAAVQAALAWRYDPTDADLSHTGTRHVIAADVAALRLFTAQFTELDRRHGGGANHTRALIADFLNRQVTPMLHSSYTDTVGRDLMSAAANIAGQLAYMAYDAGEYGASQRHYTTALRLSKAGNDHLYGAHLLANLATQAVFLGHGRDAVRLARAAIDGAGRAPATVLARLYTTEACAHAIVGDRRTCTQALRKAQTAIERSQPGDSPAWATYFSPAHFAGTAARCFRDLRLYPQALRHGPAALELAVDSARTRALHNALLATIHADHGDLDIACDYGSQALEHTSSVKSRRVRERLTELTDRLNPHRSVPIVNSFLEQHHDLLTAA